MGRSRDSNRETAMTSRLTGRVAAFALLCLPAATLAAEIVLTPPAGGGVTVTNAAANATRFRVADDGSITLPGLGPAANSVTNLCLEIATGKIGTCAMAAGGVTSIATGTGLTGGPITTTGTIGIANGGVGTAQIADGAVTAAKLAGSGCTTNQVLKFNGTTWVCAADANSGAPLPTVLVASITSCCVGIGNWVEAQALQVLIKGTPSPGKYLARVDAQLNTFGALYLDYHCKLQALTYPAFIGTPFTDLPGTRRDVSWRTGKDGSGSALSPNGVSISMQAPVTAGAFGVDVRMVCWGTWDGANPPIVDYGYGVESAVLTLLPVGGFS